MAGALACALPLAACSDAEAPGFVTASGRSFQADGEPFRFVGFNLYDAAATDRYSCSPDTAMTDGQLDAALSFAREQAGATVLRFWAYQTYTAAGTDWTGVDRVLAAAKRHGLRVLPVLEDGPGNCTTTPDPEPKSEFQDDTWFSRGYLEPWGDATVSYRDYVAKIVAHYADEPTILGWSMINEADTSARDASGRSVLVDFAEDMGRVIHDADPNHLVTVGTQSNGAPGASGADFTQVYDVPEVDFAEVHDWGQWGADDEAMPGAAADGSLPEPGSQACQARDAKIACSFAQARALGKPLVVGEAGIEATNSPARARRAEQLGAKMTAAFAAGAAGYLVWHLNSAPTDGYDVVVGYDDPLLAALKAQAASLAR